MNDGKIRGGRNAFNRLNLRRFPMLQPDEREKLEQDFDEAESSVRLEGLVPTENFFLVKARVLAGEITFEEGNREILTYHRTENSAVA